MAENKKTQNLDFEIQLQVDQQKNRKAIRELTKTVDELTDQAIKGEKETAEMAEEVREALRLQEKAWGKLSQRVLNHSRLASDALTKQLNGNKTALKERIKNIRKSENEIHLTYKLIQAADHLEDALMRQMKIKADSIEDDDERQRFLDSELQSIKQIIDLRKKEAASVKNKTAELKKQTEATEAVKETTASISKESRGRFSSRFNRAVGGSLDVMDSLRSGYSRSGFQSFIGGVKNIGASASSSLSKKAEAYRVSSLAQTGSAAKSAEKLVGVFNKLATTVGMVTRFFGMLASVVTVLIEADAKQKELYKKVGSGMGSAGLKSGDLLKITSNIVNQSLRNNPLVGGLRLNTEEMTSGANTLLSSGMSMKNLTGGFKAFNEVLETTAVASRNFGIEMSEAGTMVGDYFQSFGSGAETIRDTFTTLKQDIQSSSMTTNQFLATINSVSAQFNLFIDQTKEFSSLLTKMSQGGALSGNQMKKFMQSLSGFGPKTVDDGIRAMALYGPQIQSIARSQMGDLEKKIKTGNYGSEAERSADMRRLANLRVVSKGGLNAGAGLSSGALGSMDMVQALFKKYGVKTFGDMQGARTNVELLKQISAVTGMSDNEIQDLIEAASTLMENTSQTFDQLMDSNKAGLKKKADSATARREAEEYASQTVTKMSGLQDIANALLFKIAEVLTQIYNLFANSAIGKAMGLSGKKIEGVNLTDTRSVFMSAVESMKQELEKGSGPVTATGQASPYTLNQQKMLFGSKPSIKTTTFPAGTSPATGAASKISGQKTTSAAPAKEPPVYINAVLQLPNAQPIQLMVDKANYEREKRQ